MDISTVGWRSEPTTYAYGWKELVLYALGIGAQTSELSYVYEEMGPKVYPTFVVVPAIFHVSTCMQRAGISLASVIHTSQSVHTEGRIPSEGKLITFGQIEGFYDLKRFAQMLIRTVTTDGDGAPMFDCEWMILIRDAGGFGGPTPPKRASPKILSKTKPDWTFVQKTSPEQALLYRLNGDTNPLHICPKQAAQAGFDRAPILHGLATFGFATRAIVNSSCNADADYLTDIYGQFRRPVWPGETLVTQGWHMPQQHIYVTSVQERNEIVLTGSWKQTDVIYSESSTPSG